MMGRSTVELLLMMVVIVVLAFNIMHSFRSTDDHGIEQDKRPSARDRNQQPRQSAAEEYDDDDGQNDQEEDDEAQNLAEFRKAHVEAKSKHRQRKVSPPLLSLSDGQQSNSHPGKSKSKPSLLDDMLNLGGDKTERVFHNLTATHKFMLFGNHQEGQLCLLRSQMDQVLMERCLPNFHGIQSFLTTSYGHIGVSDPDGDSCMTVDPEQSLHLYPCREHDPAQHWELRPNVGLVNKATQYCPTHLIGVMHMRVQPCKMPAEQVFVEVDKDLNVIQEGDWLLKLAQARQARLDEAQIEINAALHRVTKERPPAPTSKRRVVVFYGEYRLEGLFTQLVWWVGTWIKLKLDQPDQRFDIIVLGDLPLFAALKRKFPQCVRKVLEDTQEPPPDSAPGACWFMEYQGISLRDPEKYDGWFNSIEILVNPKIRSLLHKYKQLLRADMDTFPTPRMRDYYIDHIYMASSAGYSNRYARTKLARAAEAAGLEYRGISNIASTYYGPPAVVTRIADLTIACGHFAKAYLFAPGTPCKLPKEMRPAHVKCGWPHGLHEGVLLLYSQELAVNHLYATGEPIVIRQWATMDVPTIEPHPTCGARMLHVYHGSDRFSKFALYAGHYKDLDLADYDLRKIRDYVTWLALEAVDQGRNRDKPLKRIGGDLSTMCKGQPMQNE